MMRLEEGQEGRTKDEWKSIAIDALHSHLQLPPAQATALASPLRSNVTIDKSAIPQYAVGHASLVDEIKSTLRRDLPSVHLVGNSWGGIGVNDCVEKAWLTVKDLTL